MKGIVLMNLIKSYMCSKANSNIDKEIEGKD